MAEVACMECRVVSVAQDVFRPDKPGEEGRVMYRLYFADAEGRVGYLYSARPYQPGDVVRLGLAERDGRLRLRVLR